MVEPHIDARRLMRWLAALGAVLRANSEQTLPAFLDFYRRFPHYGFWAADERATGEFARCDFAKIATDNEGGRDV